MAIPTAVIGFLYRERRTRRIVVGYVKSVRFAPGAGLRVHAVKNTWTKAEAYRFTAAQALEIAQQFKCPYKNDPVAVAFFGAKDAINFITQA